MKKYDVRFETNPLNIEGNNVTTVEIPLEHILHITKENKTPRKEEFIDKSKFKCSVADATVLGDNISLNVLETNLVDCDIVIFEPVIGNAGSHTLCPGIGKLQSDRENRKKQNKTAKINIIEIGDRIYVKQVPRKGLSSKLQPAYNGSFRVLDKVSDVVIKVKNIRSGNI